MPKDSSPGFTLLEIILVILLIGIITVFAGLGMIQVMRGYTLYTTGTEVSRKSQFAMARIVREFSLIDQIVSGGQTTIEYSIRNPQNSFAPLTGRTLAYSGNSVTLNGYPLADNVTDFTLEYCNLTCSSSPSSTDRYITILLEISVNDTIRSIYTGVSLPIWASNE